MNTTTRTRTIPATFAGYRLVGYTEHPRMTQETIAFDAEVHHHDTPIGTLSNDGHGGDHRFTAANATAHRAALTTFAAFPGIRDDEYGFTYDLFESLALAGDIAKTLWGTRYISLVPDMTPEGVIGSGSELNVFRAPRSAGSPLVLAEGLLEHDPAIASVVYPMRERGGVWLHQLTR